MNIFRTRTYKVEFNDYGVCHVVAPDFSTAERLFIESKYGGDDVMIKKIEKLPETSEPIVAPLTN